MKALKVIGIIVVILAAVFWGVVYFGFGGPEGLTEARQQVASDLIDIKARIVRLGLELYYTEYFTFPNTLQDLVVESDVTEITADDLSGVTFDYTLQEGGENYSLCLALPELQPTCFDGADPLF